MRVAFNVRIGLARHRRSPVVGFLTLFDSFRQQKLVGKDRSTDKEDCMGCMVLSVYQRTANPGQVLLSWAAEAPTLE